MGNSQLNPEAGDSTPLEASGGGPDAAGATPADASDPWTPTPEQIKEGQALIAELEQRYRAAGKPPPRMSYVPSTGLIMEWEDGDADMTVRPSTLPKSEFHRFKVDAGIYSERSAHISRRTGETKIEFMMDLEGKGQAEVATGVGFLDHMLTLFAKHSLFDLKVQAQGDLQVDAHHTVEDVGICLGKALAQALGDRAGIHRYGHFTLPMDETLATVTVDLGGRAYFVWRAEVPRQALGNFDSELAEDFWQAVAANALINLHVQVHYGRNVHHILEAIFKATARALRQAVELDPRMPGVPSTKGTLTT
jgi:imidazoleglycerol-phosphate dehydratase